MMKIRAVEWLLKQKKTKVKDIKKCLTCDKPARNHVSEYCLDCSEKRRLENNRLQSKKRYLKKKNETKL